MNRTNQTQVPKMHWPAEVSEQLEACRASTLQAHNEFGKIENNIYGILDGCLTRIKEAYPHLEKNMVFKSVYDEIEIWIEDWLRYSCELRDSQIKSDELSRKIQRICRDSSRLIVRLQSELQSAEQRDL